MNPLRRVRQARQRAAETDQIIDDCVAETAEVYNQLFKALIRSQEDLGLIMAGHREDETHG